GSPPGGSRTARPRWRRGRPAHAASAGCRRIRTAPTRAAPRCRPATRIRCGWPAPAATALSRAARRCTRTAATRRRYPADVSHSYDPAGRRWVPGIVASGRGRLPPVLRVAVPDQTFAEQLADTGAEVSVWTIGQPAPDAGVDLLVLPYMIPVAE